jgi:hypothetical protein
MKSVLLQLAALDSTMSSMAVHKVPDYIGCKRYLMAGQICADLSQLQQCKRCTHCVDTFLVSAMTVLNVHIIFCLTDGCLLDLSLYPMVLYEI